jgi:hypothetical protein
MRVFGASKKENVLFIMENENIVRKYFGTLLHAVKQ